MSPPTARLVLTFTLRFTTAQLAMLAVFGCLLASNVPGAAQEAGQPDSPTSDTRSSDSPNPPNQPALADQQSQVAERYRKLEELLLRLADVEADENPERAALLRRAARQSRESFVLEKLLAASESLRTQQFAKAVESQGSARDGLDKLLNLLLSEDRPQRIRDEKKRIANMIKELKVVERLQRSTRARTENGAELQDVSEEQSAIGDRSEKVNDELKESEVASQTESGDDPESKPQEGDSPSEDKAPPADPTKPDQANPPAEKPKSDEQPESDSPKDGDQPSQPSPAEEMKPGEPNPADKPSAPSAPSQPKPNDNDQPPSASPPQSPPSESPPSESPPSESPPAEGQPSESQPGQPQEQPPQAPQSPEQQAQSQLNEAIKQMREAEKELDESKRDGAVQKQKEAEGNLRAAIDRLEKILRQLREEEMQRELARLEARLRKMAAMQGKVLDDTKLLAATPESQRDRQVELKAGNLAFEEKKIVLEADRAMLLLREEGSSVAFPEVVAQIRADMQRVAERLAATKLDTVTTGIQDDILAALEEMILALQQAQRDLEKKKQQQDQQGDQPQGGQQGEPPLVEQIAELKLIRTMETRIKSTTERYAGMIDEEASGANEVLPLLQDLSGRQSNLYRITRDLLLKRNQ